MDIVAPSHTCYDNNQQLVDPTTSTVRVGTGAIDGCPGAPVCNDYATSFGGTSHASPTIAGDCGARPVGQPAARLGRGARHPEADRRADRLHSRRRSGSTSTTMGTATPSSVSGTATVVSTSRLRSSARSTTRPRARRRRFARTSPTSARSLHPAGTPSPDIWSRPTDDPIPTLARGAIRRRTSARCVGSRTSCTAGCATEGRRPSPRPCTCGPRSPTTRASNSATRRSSGRRRTVRRGGAQPDHRLRHLPHRRGAGSTTWPLAPTRSSS